MAMTFSDSEWQKEVTDFKGVVLVDFWAEWCVPCRIQGPIIDSLAQKHAGKANIKIGKLDVDANPDTQSAFRVMSIPTLIFFKDGQVAETFVGLRPEGDIESKLLELAAS